MRRPVALLAAVALAAALLLSVGGSSPAVAAPGGWLSRINGYRAQHGLGPLQEDPATSVVAQTWTERMATTNTLAHNPLLSQQVTTPWTRLGENVGYGADEASLFQAFVNSSGHRANLLGSYNAVGIGQVLSGGRLWTTHVFLLTSAVLQPPPPPTSMASGQGAPGNPAMVQSRYGTVGNFELVYPAAEGGIGFMWRNNDGGGGWSAPLLFGQSLGRVDAVTMIQSSFGNLEVVARAGDRLHFFWRGANGWNGPYQLATGATGNPVLIQSRFGTVGNFELVYPSTAGGIGFMWRNNSAGGGWSLPSVFGQSLGAVGGVTMIQSTYGNLEVVARAADRLHFFWRGSGWTGPSQIASGAAGNPVMVQSRYGTARNFELTYPSSSGGIGFMWRNNAVGGVWSAPSAFGQSLGTVGAVTMIQSTYGNLEVVARAADKLHFLWRGSNGWNGPGRIL